MDDSACATGSTGPPSGDDGLSAAREADDAAAPPSDEASSPNEDDRPAVDEAAETLAVETSQEHPIETGADLKEPEVGGGTEAHDGLDPADDGERSWATVALRARTLHQVLASVYGHEFVEFDPNIYQITLALGTCEARVVFLGEELVVNCEDPSTQEQVTVIVDRVTEALFESGPVGYL
jgi:hypothetical protein